MAFLNAGSREWTGGMHYLQNLLFAVSSLPEREVELYVFVGNNTDNSLLTSLREHATIIRSSLFDRKSPAWFFWRIIWFVTGSHFVLNRLLRKYKIEVISHSNVAGRGLPFKTINWIPDFQHMHLPDMFPAKEKANRDKEYARFIKLSDRVVVSSENAAEDLTTFLPGYENKVRVIRFVSQPSINIGNVGPEDLKLIEEQHHFEGKFFYLPNQFWRHKNHRLVFEAVNILKKAGEDILLLCSGYEEDYRHRNYILELKDFINRNDLEKNIRLLGLVPYKDVFVLMRHSLAVINPSLFEGWSSTVEEAKSIGKGMILSSIAVHREQDPPGSSYFDPTDPEELASILQKWWQAKEGGPDLDLEQQAARMLPERTRAFGQAYLDVVKEICGRE